MPAPWGKKMKRSRLAFLAAVAGALVLAGFDATEQRKVESVSG